VLGVLLGDHSVVREADAQGVCQEGVGAAIGFGDRVGLALPVDAEIGGVDLEQDRAGCTRQLARALEL
jgi:hypothetical protein